MKKLITLFLMVLLLMAACNNHTEKKTDESTILQPASIDDSLSATSTSGIAKAESDPLQRLPILHFPIIDSTRFENFEKSGTPDSGLLKKINFDPRRKDATNFRLNYRIPFSDNFNSVVITYRGGENELFTTLITFDKNGRIIDKLDIAYDEVAESAFSKTSRIEKNKIVITHSNWMNEEPILEKETYKVESNGKFSKVQTKERQE